MGPHERRLAWEEEIRRAAAAAQASEGPMADMFGRRRVSTPETQFDSKHLYDKNSLYWDETVGAGSSSVHSAAGACVDLTVAAAAESVIRQTKRRWNYQPGKSQLVLLTGVLGSPATGITRRVGYFDADNGLFFEVNPGGVAVVVRSSVSGSPVDTVIPQHEWSEDRLDGTCGESNLSGYLYDPSKTCIYWIAFEWLGVGTVAFGVVIDGKLIVCHYAHHSQTTGAVYMSTPNLPVRYEIVNDGTGGTATLKQICTTVIAEGGIQAQGTIRAVDRGGTGLTIGSGVIAPLVGLRLKTTHLGASVLVQFASVIASTSSDFRWFLVLNPTVAGVDAASWTDLDNAAVQYDVSRTSANTLTGGTVLASGYAAADVSTIGTALLSALTLGATIAGTRDELVLGVQNLAAGNETFFGAMTWRELL